MNDLGILHTPAEVHLHRDTPLSHKARVTDNREELAFRSVMISSLSRSLIVAVGGVYVTSLSCLSGGREKLRRGSIESGSLCF